MCPGGVLRPALAGAHKIALAHEESAVRTTPASRGA